MEAEARRITKRIREYYDKDLAAFVSDDKICVFRKTKRWVTYSFNGFDFSYPHPQWDYIFALTDTWGLNGKPVLWGIDQIYEHLKEIDARDNPRLMEELEAKHDKAKELKDRRRRNNIEAFCRDWRRSFAKATDGINTSTLEKIDKRRLKDGYY